MRKLLRALCKTAQILARLAQWSLKVTAQNIARFACALCANFCAPTKSNRHSNSGAKIPRLYGMENATRSKKNAKGHPLIKRDATSKSDAIKRALKSHLAGREGAGSGLIFKALEKLAHLVDDADTSTALQAIDKIVKLLPYAVTREENPSGLIASQGGPVQINIHFDDQIKQRLQGTHLQGLISNLVPSSAQSGTIEDAEVVEVTPPPMPGGATPNLQS